MRSSKSRDDRDLYLSNSIMSIWPEYAQSDVFYDTKLSSIKFKRLFEILDQNIIGLILR